ncbi:DUF2892 domain-containing protein [Motiliproteus sp. MSK22-1]|uniref:YgaP family membrane protein n=1 Tax=Motiliproteus sp. MSK22-1 TaxID=1897630 RepID=UPI000978B69D|nr:DUF2892 domain-containing protein [Motiliproteus sp. MSK22-1]OMH27988.1 hypothetical protein BGP75_21665 [Motiliproteus sp. MSK22-1]
MQKNIGTADQIIRIVVGLVLISLVFVGPQTIWGWVGAVVILIALFGFCPLYKVLGFSSCSKCKADG